MILVDASVWIDHLHGAEPALIDLLNRSAVAQHPMVVGELAMGSLRDRDSVLSALARLPSVRQATHDEAIGLVARPRLYGSGLSLVDVHLLTSLLLSPGTGIWTRDSRLLAAASLEVARGKPGAERVRWILGDATTLPSIQVDVALMTANVAQVFVTDEAWEATLRGIRDAVRPGGRLVFETRVPAVEAWRGWNRDETFQRVEIAGIGVIETWDDLLDVSGQLVTFRDTTVFASDGAVIVSDSTLRFRSRAEVERSLAETGWTLDEIRDAPDRPGREFVFVASRAESD